MADLRASVSRRDTCGGLRTAPIHGFLPSLPRVGVPLLLYASASDGTVASLMTSIVERMLIAPDGALFVQTRQSVYRVTFDEPLVELPPPTRVRVSLDGYALTVESSEPDSDSADGIETND